MRFAKKLTSVVLALCMLLSVASVGVVTASAEDTAYETYAQASIRGSNILHCFNWSYNQIKANLSEIAKAGYTAVQTSPVQSPKDYNSSWTKTSEEWWKMYQPLGFSISNNSWLGTKAELTSLCTEADKYGIKVVVDIVANHLANNGTDGGTYSYINIGVESDLKNANYYHTNNTRTNDNNRYNITQYHLGMPDLNTGYSYIQQRALGLLEECIDCGVDGFRFDAAKHIELPTDPSNCRSNFWPTVINGATDYAEQNGKETPFYYGEILGGAGTDISNYTQYMAVTDNYTGDRVLDKVYYQWAPDLSDGTYYKGGSASDSVLWAESHDTYMGESGSSADALKNTSGVENNIINRAWAIVGARAESTALFFARPNSTMGYASTDGNWKSKAVAEVNKFKNHFAGTNEYLANSGDKVAYIERGTKGVVISKLDGGGQVSLTAHQMEDGTYTDYVTGGTFTVSNGVISGNVDSQGVAVVYNAQDSAVNFIEADTLYLDPGISSWKQSGKRYAMYVFNSSSSAWVSMADTDSDGIFEAAVPAGNWTGVIFCTMNASDSTNRWENKINQTVDLFPTDGNDLFTVTGADSGDSSKFNGTWSVYSSQEEETTEPATQPETEPDTQPTTDEPESNTYTVTWKNGDDTLKTETYEYGETPTYKGEAPQKPADLQNTYTFSGWTPEITDVAADVTYTAQYTPTAHNWQVSWTWNGYQSADAHFSCTDCAMTTDKAAAITSVTTAPTMTVAGSVVYTATVTGPDEQTYTDSKTEVLPATAVHLAGHSISLDGDIAVNFYMELDSALADSQTAYMQFSVPDTSPEYQDQKVYVKDLTPIVQGGKTYYVFKCRVAAKNMDAQISAQLINGDDVSDTYTYSVREYANYLLDHLDVPQYAAAANLVREMLTYGDNANVYFDETAEALAPSNTVIPEYTSTVASFADSIFNGASLSLKSKTTLSLFFKSGSDLTISMQGKTEGVDYELQHVGNDYVIRIRNIPVFDLDKPITVQVNGKDAVSYSPLAYCFKAQDSSNVKLANTVKALYNYWLAAKSYFGGIEPEEDETEKL